MSFGRNLKKLRLKKKVSMTVVVKDFEDRYGVIIYKSMLSRWENGMDISGRNLVYLSHYFEVEPHELMGIEFKQ